MSVFFDAIFGMNISLADETDEYWTVFEGYVDFFFVVFGVFSALEFNQIEPNSESIQLQYVIEFLCLAFIFMRIRQENVVIERF
jgi:hypothetical protein